MPDTAVRYVIEVDSKDAVRGTNEFNAANKGAADVAVASYSRAAKGSDTFAAQMIANNKNVIASNQQASLSHSLMADRIKQVGEAGLITFGVLKGGTAIIAGYAASVQGATISTGALVNTVRAGEIAYTAFKTGLTSTATLATSAGIGIAILTEESLKLAYARGKALQQESFLAAKYNLTFDSVQKLSFASRQAGQDSNFLAEAVTKLRASAQTTAGGGAFKALGIDTDEVKDAAKLLEAVGAGLDKIIDPIERSRQGFALFNKNVEDAAKFLPGLNSQIKTSTAEFEFFQSGLGPQQAEDIDRFKRGIDGLANSFFGLGARVGATNLQFSNFIASKGAQIGNAFLNPPVTREDTNLKHVDANNEYLSTYYNQIAGDNPLQRLGRYLGFDGDVITRGQLQKLDKGVNEATGVHSASLFSADLNAQIAKEFSAKYGAFNNSKEGLQAELSILGSFRSAADEALRKDAIGIATQKGDDGKTLRLLTPQEKIQNQNQFNVYSTAAEALQSRLDALESATKSQAEIISAQKSAAEFRKHSLEAEYSGLARVDVVERETLAQYGTSPKARQDIGVGVAALRERAQREYNEEERGLYRIELLSRAAHRNAIVDDPGLFAYQATQFEYKQKTEDQQRATSESAALFGVNEAGFARDAQLRALEKIDAQTVRSKQDLEQKKADIENDYLVKSLAIRSDAIERANTKEISDLQILLDSHRITQETFTARRDAIVSAGGEQGRQLTSETQALINKSKEDARIKSDQIQRDADLQQFNSIKSGATGLIDTLFTHTRDLGQYIGNFFKHAVLAPLEEIASSQVARLIFGAINPGTSVSFASGGGGTGLLGKYGGLLGHFGFGTQPIFGKRGPGSFDVLPGSDPSSRPAVDTTASLFGGGAGIPFFSGAQAIAAQLPGMFGLGFAAPIGSHEAIGAGTDTSGLPVLPSGLIDRTGTATPLNGPLVLGGATVLGGAAGLSYGTPHAPALGLTGTLSNAIRGRLGDIPGLFGFGANGTYGSGIYGTGIVGALGSFATSPAAGAIGGALLLNSIQRKPGAVSTIESAGGGALTGAYLGAQSASVGGVNGALIGGGGGLLVGGIRTRGVVGAIESTAGGALVGAGIGSLVAGPFGALVGAGIGAAVGLSASLLSDLVPTARQQIKDQVKNLYHLSISNQIADQLIQIAKQSYGGSYSVAIRSKPAQDLLSLFAQSTGQNALFGNVPHPAYLTQSGGNVTQQASYIGGQAYSFGGALGVTNGIPTATIPTYVAGTQTIRTNGVTYGGLPSASQTIQLDAEATTALLRGQAVDTISGNPRLIADANAEAQQGSYDRRGSAARLLSPGLITGYA